MSKPKVKRRIDVMPSSTTKDLPEHRKNVIDAIIRVGWHPLTMEYEVGKPDEEAISYSLRLVDESEVYILILGTRYGYIPKEKNPKQISITQMEYEAALKRPSLKRLYFVMDLDKHPIMAGHLDKDESAVAKMNAFREHITTNHVVSFFSSVAELRSLVIQALYELRLDMPVVEEEDEEKKSIPLPPNLYAFPSYSDQNAPFVGRKAEIKQLNEWANPESNKAMLILEAIGGMGKSALAWKWMQDRAVAFEGYFWYSFYEGGADMRECIRHALAYVGRQDPDELTGQPLAKMLTELEAVLKEKRYLLVLDGLERVLVAYHRWDAAQMQDDSVPEERDYRATTNPEDADVLKRLAACIPSRIMLTSRLMPMALEEGGTVLAGVIGLPLLGLSPEDARRFWRDKGIKWWDEGRLDKFIGQFGRHSLLLKILAGEILKRKAAKATFDIWYEIFGVDVEVFKDVVAKRHHILEMAYKGLSDEAKKILSQIAALGSAVDLDTLNVFNPYLPPKLEAVPKPDDWALKYYKSEYEAAEMEDTKVYYKSQFEEESARYQEHLVQYETYINASEAYLKSREYRRAVAQFDRLLQELEERGLLWWDKSSQQYDLHPVVRGYAFEQLEANERPNTFEHIYNYFDSQERDFSMDNVKSLRDLQNTLAMYNALIGAEKFDIAIELFLNRLKHVLIFGGLGLYRKAYELLLPFFPNGLQELPNLESRETQGSILNCMGVALSLMGREQDALHVKGLTLKLRLELKDAENVGVNLANYGVSMQDANQFAQALRSFQYLIQLANLLNYQDHIAISHTFLFGIYKTLGFWEKADEAYSAFYSALPSSQSIFWQAKVERTHVHLQFYRDIDNQKLLEMIARAEELSEKGKNPQSMRNLKYFKGEVLLRIGKFDEAKSLFSEAIRLNNEAGVRDEGSWGGLARAYLQEGHSQEALRIVTEELRDDGQDEGYSAAYVYWKTGEVESAKEEALKNYRWAWAQGEPYVRRYDLERVRALLKEMGVEEPSLPVWDESKYEPFPYEEEVKAFIEDLKRIKGKAE
jgi:tetratricopeptide (TPR) repeat protein